MEEPKEKPEPIRQSVRVDCPIEDAFRLFTEEFAQWWPLAADGKIEPRVGGRVFERTRSGEERDWGSVTVWDPPSHLQLTWYPGTDRAERQTVDIDFCVEADGTRVTLIHSGWETTSTILGLNFAKFVSEQMLVTA
jgi:hypothetical protein